MDDLCPRCQCCPKTVMHMLWDCDDVKEVWSTILSPDYLSQFFSLGLEGWLNLNLSSKKVGPLHMMGGRSFLVLWFMNYRRTVTSLFLVEVPLWGKTLWTMF